MSEEKTNYRSLPQANLWLNNLQGILRIVEIDDNYKSLQENYGLKKGILTYIRSHIQVIEIENNKVLLTDLGQKLLKLYNENRTDDVLKIVMNQSFQTNDFYQLFLDFLDKVKGRRFSIITLKDLSKEFHEFSHEKGLDYKEATIDITFYVLYNTFILANFLIKRYFENTKKIDLLLNVTKLQNFGFLEKPKEPSKWPLPIFAEELVSCFHSFKKKTPIRSEILDKKLGSVNYLKLRLNVITRINRKYSPSSEAEKLFDSLFFELMNKNPSLIETQKLIQQTKVIIHTKSKDNFNLW